MKKKNSLAASSFIYGQIDGKKFFNLLKPYPIFFGLSILLMFVFLFQISVKGFVLGTDFRGGLENRISFSEEIKLEDLKKDLEKAGLNADVERILSKESTFIIRFSLSNEQKENEVRETEKIFGDFISNYKVKAEIEQTRLVSGVVSSDNKRNAINTSLVVIFLIVLYLTLRFEFRYAMGALFAVVHDVLFMLGFASFMNFEANVLTMVAVLTVFGYSVNDTIIVFDRIRELQKKDAEAPFLLIMTYAVRFTIKRTLITSLTTLFVVFSLFFSTTGEYRNFAGLLIVGILSGTYSSTYVALPFLLIYQKFAQFLRKFFQRKR